MYREKVVHLTTEVAPLAKVGGLADVACGLSKALIRKKKEVEVLLPFYDLISRDALPHLVQEVKEFPLLLGTRESGVTLWSTIVEGLPLLLLELKEEKRFFNRGRIYGEQDDTERFLAFTYAALEALARRGKRVDILHLHDWPTGFGASLYRDLWKARGFTIQGVILTLHNLRYQGVCPVGVFHQIGLDGYYYLRERKFQDPHLSDQINLLKGAIIDADFITTVSPTYAREIQSHEGAGLESLLCQQSKKVKGILNGIETEYWNPGEDLYLCKQYPNHPSKIEELLAGKRENRRFLLEKLQLDLPPSVPLVCSIGRLVYQKGPELIMHAIEVVLKRGGGFILLGTAPERQVEEQVRLMQKKFQANRRAYFHFHFNEQLAHLLFAAADFLIVPSYYEPCGLTQIIALLYGTVPIVHRVGGLRDTIVDIEDPVHGQDGNGYLFTAPTKEKVEEAIDRAFDHFLTHPGMRKTILAHALVKDWSWNHSVEEYVEIYRFFSQACSK